MEMRGIPGQIGVGPVGARALLLDDREDLGGGSLSGLALPRERHSRDEFELGGIRLHFLAQRAIPSTRLLVALTRFTRITVDDQSRRIRIPTSRRLSDRAPRSALGAVPSVATPQERTADRHRRTRPSVATAERRRRTSSALAPRCDRSTNEASGLADSATHTVDPGLQYALVAPSLAGRLQGRT